MRRFGFITLLIVAMLAVAGCGNNDDKSDDNANENYKENTNNAEAETGLTETETEDTEEDKDNAIEGKVQFDGKELVTDTYTLVITDYKIIQPGEGNNLDDVPIMGFWFDVTLHEGEDDQVKKSISAWNRNFEAAQIGNGNNEERLELGLLPDVKHLENRTLIPGETNSSSISYQLIDETKPVQLIFISGSDSEEEMTRHEFSIDEIK